MSKKLKRFLAILSAIFVIGGLVSSITCVHYFHLNTKAFWWSLSLSLFVIDVCVGLYIFYNSKRPDETKAFWLITILLLPLLGCLLFLIYGLNQKCNFNDSDNNHAKLLSSIFKAKKSIKIYSDNFYPSYDTFNALNFASYKDVKVELILSTQTTKSKQEYLEYKLEQLLEKRINLYFTNLCVEQSFMIVDDQEVIICPKNFNFKHIYSSKEFKISNEINSAKTTWERTLVRSSLFDYKTVKFSRSKRLKFAFINIFYSFL